jgi:hypothetical protein
MYFPLRFSLFSQIEHSHDLRESTKKIIYNIKELQRAEVKLTRGEHGNVVSVEISTLKEPALAIHIARQFCRRHSLKYGARQKTCAFLWLIVDLLFYFNSFKG